MKPFFKNKKIWVQGSFFSLGIVAVVGFSHYKGWFGSDFAERTPQSKFRMVYQASQELVEKLRRDVYNSNLNLQGEDLREAYLKGIEFENVNFSGADMRKANLSDSRLTNVDLKSANLKKAKLKKTEIVIDGNDFDLERLRGPSKYEPKSTKSVYRSYLDGTNFESANLQDARFYNRMKNNIYLHASFKDAKMQGASLEYFTVGPKTDFRGAKLQAADLSQVRGLERAKLEGAIYDESTRLPFDDKKAKRLGMIKR